MLRASSAFGRDDGVLAQAEKLEGSCQLAVGIGDALLELEHQDLILWKMFVPTGQGTVVHASLESIGYLRTVAAKACRSELRQILRKKTITGSRSKSRKRTPGAARWRMGGTQAQLK